MPLISISPKQVVRVLLLSIPVLFGLQCLLRLVLWSITEVFNVYPQSLYYLIQKFHFDSELSVPSWYSSGLLLIAAVLLGIIAVEKKQVQSSDHHLWKGLALIFVCLSLDEASAIHELAIAPLNLLFNFRGVLQFSWIVIAIPLLLILALVYLKFLMALPKSSRQLWLLAAGLYIGGAVGMEMIGGYVVERFDANRILYTIVFMTEETLEMVGINVFIYALLGYIAHEFGGIKVIFNDVRSFDSRKYNPLSMNQRP